MSETERSFGFVWMGALILHTILSFMFISPWVVMYAILPFFDSGFDIKIILMTGTFLYLTIVGGYHIMMYNLLKVLNYHSGWLPLFIVFAPVMLLVTGLTHPVEYEYYEDDESNKEYKA